MKRHTWPDLALRARIADIQTMALEIAMRPFTREELEELIPKVLKQDLLDRTLEAREKMTRTSH